MSRAEETRLARRVTMREIAERVGVSTNTVSKALSNKPDVSQATREVIQRAAAELGYDYSATARAGGSYDSGIVGLVTSDNANPFFAQAVKGVEWTLQSAGFTLLLCNTNEEYVREKNVINMLVERGVDGMILTPTQIRHDDIRSLQDAKVPLVLLGRHFLNVGVPSVISDDSGGAFYAVDHLLRLGHRRVLFLNAPEYISSAAERLQGYREAFRSQGIDVDDSVVRTCRPTKEAAYNEMKSILLEGIEFTAVFAFSDLMMLGVIQLFQERDIRVPDDVSLVGFDDIDFVSLLSPSLTTVTQDRFGLGARSAECLLRLMRGESPEEPEIVLPTHLTVRGSTARA